MYSSGCGPIGLITAAVAHAYSARKIIGFDINPSRVEFAKKYISPLTGKPIFDHVFLNTELTPDSDSESQTPAHPLKTKSNVGTDGEVGDIDAGDDHHEETYGDKKWEAGKRRVAKWVEEVGLTSEEGVDRVVEASGTEDGILLGVAIVKQGGTFLQVGLNHVQTSLFPGVAVTNKEIDFKGRLSSALTSNTRAKLMTGITRYTASCFPSAIDMLARGVVDLKPLITVTYPLTKAKEALEAVRSGKQIKVIIYNQE
jgi:D-xylulose reductase